MIGAEHGASRSGICRDLEGSPPLPGNLHGWSWDENERQHERLTQADRSIEESLRGYVRGPPAVRHLLYL